MSKAITYEIIDDPDHQAAARAHGNVVGPVEKVLQCDLKAVATRARVVVEAAGRIVSHILNLDFVVDGEVFFVAHRCSGRGGLGTSSSF